MEVPEFFQGNYCSQFSAENHHSLDASKSGNDHFIVEELLDFSNEDADLTDCCGGGGGGAAAFDNVAGNNSTESSTVTLVDGCNSCCEPSFPGDNSGHFSSDLCVPYDDLAELEWLSNFVEESFACEDLQKLQLISGMKAGKSEQSSETCQFQTGNDNHSDITNGSNPVFNPEMAVPGKARSKRSRAAPCNWASRLLMLSPTTSSLSETTASTETVTITGQPLPPPVQGKKSGKGASSKKKDGGDEGNNNNNNDNNNVEGRKCLHCATDKTPQWRTGPMGPKTLCNACGVRYKSGRLVPEYRPAASPTFVLTKHSNSHRKVLELRRQKEMQMAHQHHHQQQPFMHHHQFHHQHHHQNMVFDLSNGDDYLIHQHVGPEFRQLI